MPTMTYREAYEEGRGGLAEGELCYLSMDKLAEHLGYKPKTSDIEHDLFVFEPFLDRGSRQDLVVLIRHRDETRALLHLDDEDLPPLGPGLYFHRDVVEDAQRPETLVRHFDACGIVGVSCANPERVREGLVRHADESLHLNAFDRFRLPMGQRNRESDPDGGDCGLDDAKTHSVVGAPPLTDPFGDVPAPRTAYRIEKAAYSTSGGRGALVRNHPAR